MLVTFAFRDFVADQANLQNDIALLRLSRPVILGPDANVICLPSALDSYIPATCTIIGWGEICK